MSTVKRANADASAGSQCPDAAVTDGKTAGRARRSGPRSSTGGVNFSLFSRTATGVELLFFDREDDATPSRVVRHRSGDRTAPTTTGTCSCRACGRGSSTATGSRGRRRPSAGCGSIRAKVLLDPYGRGVVVPKNYDREAARRAGDNAATAMKSVVVDPSAYDWEGDVPLRRPSARTIIYEMHVRGFTRHPSSGVGEKTRGTYAGLIEKIPYLQQLGITAVELLPVFQFDAQDCSAGKGQLLGLCADLVLRAAPGVQLAAGSARAGRRISRHGQGAAPRGHRGHSRRRVQPHRRGRSRRADALLPRHRQPDLLHPRRGRRAVRQLHRLRQHAQRQPSRSCGG